jgi:hypothetical protein
MMSLGERRRGCQRVTRGRRVVGVGFTFLPGLSGGSLELPVEEAGAEAAGDGLGFLGSGVVAEDLVGEAEGFRVLQGVAVRAAQEHVPEQLASPDFI